MSLESLQRRLARLARNPREEAVARVFSRFRGDPVAYATDHLGRVLTPKQVEILTKLEQPPYRVLARSANTQGKTFTAALKCSQFYDCYDPSITLATAPTYDQVRDLLFRELRTIRPDAAGFAPKDTRLQSSPNHFVHGLATNHPDRFQGRHIEHLGILFDEATGLDGWIWGRGETMFESTGGHWWLATYNPNDSASPVYAQEESGAWSLVVLSALEHPNVLAELQGLPPPIPGAIRLDTILRRMAAECEQVSGTPDPAEHFEFPADSGAWWRPLTPDFEAQVLGRWPVSPTAALFSPLMAEQCFTTFARAYSNHWQIAVGCDVARFGDDKTAIAVRVGPCLQRLETHTKVDTSWIAQRLRQVVNETLDGMSLDRSLSTTIPVFIDDTGGYGAGVIDQADGYCFRGVNASAESPDPRFPNTRSYLWCNLAALASAGVLDLSRVAGGERLALRQELTTARYSIDTKGRRVVEPKAHIKERLRRSPDRTDAIGLAYYLAADSLR